MQEDRDWGLQRPGPRQRQCKCEWKISRAHARICRSPPGTPRCQSQRQDGRTPAARTAHAACGRRIGRRSGEQRRPPGVVMSATRDASGMGAGPARETRVRGSRREQQTGVPALPGGPCRPRRRFGACYIFYRSQELNFSVDSASGPVGAIGTAWSLAPRAPGAPCRRPAASNGEHVTRMPRDAPSQVAAAPRTTSVTICNTCKS